MSDSNHATPHLLVIEARFYEDIADALYQGASAELDAAGVTHERVAVPGVFEIPAVIRMAVRSMDFFAGRRRFDGYVALGCVIRGETTHYDYVRSEEHTSEIQSLMRISYAVFCLKKKKTQLYIN